MWSSGEGIHQGIGLNVLNGTGPIIGDLQQGNTASSKSQYALVCVYSRTRQRVGQRLADITPYQQEVERHMGLLSSQLLGVVSGEHPRTAACVLS